jgi:O-antigen/teichoic acid export membrane protein
VVLADQLVGLLGHGKYDLAASVVLFISYGNFFRGLYYTVSVGTDLAEKTHLTTFTQIAGTAASLALNFLLIPRIGIQGAGIAFLASNVLVFVSMYVLAQRVHRIPYDLVRFLAVLVLNLAVALLPIDSLAVKVVVLVLLAGSSAAIVFSRQLSRRVSALRSRGAG